MKERTFVIAIDGPAGSGKSTTAKKTAQILHYLYLDSGAMYRAVTLAALQNDVDIQDGAALLAVIKRSSISFETEKDRQKIYLDGRDVTHAIREPRVTDVISEIASNPLVRNVLVPKQRDFARHQSLVAEGRDMGTVVFPDADLKIFMVADLETRARRRYEEYLINGIQADLNKIKEAIKARDIRDTERRYSPLRKAKDAMEIDTSVLSIPEQVDFVVQKARERGAEWN